MTIEDTFRRLRNPVPPPPERVRGKPRPNRLPALPSPLRRGKVLDCPEPGFFRLRQARRGVWVPAIIWRPCPMIIPEPFEDTPGPDDWCLPAERSRLLRARIGEDEVDPLLVWERGYSIGAAEFYYRMALREWAVVHAPDQPEARPRDPVDLTTIPSLF